MRIHTQYEKLKKVTFTLTPGEVHTAVQSYIEKVMHHGPYHRMDVEFMEDGTAVATVNMDQEITPEGEYAV